MNLGNFRPTRLQGIVWALTVIIPVALVASIAAAGNLHPLVHGFWGLAGLTVFSAIALAAPGGLGVWTSNKQWNAIPVCRACGRKMIPAQVRVTWWTRLRYYRCDCARKELTA